jgi:hypothetical protein
MEEEARTTDENKKEGISIIITIKELIRECERPE